MQFKKHIELCEKREKAVFRQMITAARLAQVDADSFKRAMKELD